MRTDRRTDIAMQVFVIRYKNRIYTFLKVVIVLDCQLPLGVARFSKVIIFLTG
jgi:hypothetical protein